MTANKTKRALWAKNAQAYEAEYNAADKSLVDNIRKAKSEGGFFVPAEAKLILVVRIRGYSIYLNKYQHPEPTSKINTQTFEIEITSQCCPRQSQ